MIFEVKPYTWDYGKPNAVPGVKIASNRNGEYRYMFVPDTELFDIATALADHIDGLNR